MENDILLIREYILDTQTGSGSVPKYTDEKLESYLEEFTYPECVASFIWKLKMTELGQKATKGLKSASVADDSHSFHDLNAQMQFYRDMVNMYRGKCSSKKGRRVIPY